MVKYCCGVPGKKMVVEKIDFALREYFAVVIFNIQIEL
jgi:hypothetical protein